MEVEALHAGADAFCALPVSAALFEARVVALLRRVSGTFATTESSTVDFDPSQRILRVGDTVIELSFVECAIAAKLYASLGVWVPTRELWSVLAKNEPQHGASLLRTHICNMRKKLGAKRWALRTERGRGIMLTHLRLSDFAAS
ncbi:MAG TPA: hypothetical protein VJT73_03820 [Polyangiaceae bacterium]|nr:hypothetical protein [Polyangiaceae bacterium]